MSRDQRLILYHYSLSPYARRITWYLALRGLEYSECLQPPILPRDDLAAIGVSYRRIPVLAIGADIYNDSRLIIRKLEEMYPEGCLGASTPDQRAIEKLLEKWVIDAGLFVRAVQLLPSNIPMLQDPKYLKDREQLSGKRWDRANVEKIRPEALPELYDAFEFLETTLLEDGRDWILGTPKPRLADIEAIWPLHWLANIKGALPPGYISKREFPKVFAWIARFHAAISLAKASAPKPTILKGSEALEIITNSGFAEPEVDFVEDAPTQLKKGETVEVHPIDSGYNNRDRGQLIALSKNEVVISSHTKSGDKEVRIHCPRHGFRIRKVPSVIRPNL